MESAYTSTCCEYQAPVQLSTLLEGCETQAPRPWRIERVQVLLVAHPTLSSPPAQGPHRCSTGWPTGPPHFRYWRQLRSATRDPLPSGAAAKCQREADAHGFPRGEQGFEDSRLALRARDARAPWKHLRSSCPWTEPRGVKPQGIVGCGWGRSNDSWGSVPDSAGTGGRRL